MRSPVTAYRICVCACLSLAVSAGGCRVPPPRTVAPTGAHQLAELWEEPADLSARALFDGPGGAEGAPDASTPYEFVSEKTGGFSSGFHVHDAAGHQWNVKQGPEAQTEVVLSRVLWAVGYHQQAVYYLPQWKLSRAGTASAQTGGRFRQKSKDEKDEGSWSWLENPFAGTQPSRGLVVILLLFNQWDLKTSNNSIYKLSDPSGGPKEWYAVRDLGAALGRTPSFLVFHGTRNDVSAFEREGFITGVTDGHVHFAMTIHGPEHALLAGIAPSDVRWACDLLSRLDERQWQDAFRAGGYDPATAGRFIAKLRAKIAEGQRAGGASTGARVDRARP
jgi:hypothetical protein